MEIINSHKMRGAFCLFLNMYNVPLSPNKITLPVSVRKSFNGGFCITNEQETLRKWVCKDGIWEKHIIVLIIKTTEANLSNLAQHVALILIIKKTYVPTFN